MTIRPAGERRPRIALVTGEPGSGKTTLGTKLAVELQVPFVARDQVRRGLFLTAGGWSERPGRVPSRDESVEAFLTMLETTAALGVSCIAEYVLRRDRPADLERITSAGDCVVLVTTCARALERFESRHRADPLINRTPVLEALGYATVEDHTADAVERMRTVSAHMRTTFAVPTLVVNTDTGYDPPFAEVLRFVTGDDPSRRLTP